VRQRRRVHRRAARKLKRGSASPDLLSPASQAIEKGLRDAVLAVLEARNLTPNAEERGRLELETDADKLRRWIGRAAVAGSVQEALD
jgi:hypothetical protein